MRISALFILFSLYSFNSYSQLVRKLQGRVIDFDTKEPLKGATIRLREPFMTTISSDSGAFALSIEPGEYVLIISYVGYSPRLFTVLVFNDQHLQFGIKKQSNTLLDEVIVNAEMKKNKLKETEMGIVRINPEQLKRIPVAFGEPDILKALTLQPGVVNAGEGAGGFYVRGGNADQNLVLLDGAPLFNTSHLLGFYTTVSADIAQEITLYKGTIPAQYGGRLSSLLNIDVKPGDTARTNYSGGISPVSGRFFMEGYALNKKLTFTTGLRIAYPNLLLNLFPKNFKKSRAFFYDGLTKGAYTFGNNHTLSATLYRSLDKFEFDSATAYKWISEIVTINYAVPLCPKLQMKINALYSGFQSDLEGREKNYESLLTSYIKQKQGQIDFTYLASPRIKFQGGSSIIFYDILPSKERPGKSGSQIISRELEKEKGMEGSGYVSTDIEINETISLQTGIRYADYRYLGAKTTYSYKTGIPQTRETIADTSVFSGNEVIANWSGAEPRVSLKISLGNSTAAKIGYHRGQQFIHLITITNAISPVDFWKLSDAQLKQQKGDQYSAGVFHNFIGYDLSVEGYYKKLKNLVEYKNGATLLLNPIIETAMVPAEGYAYGTEFSVSKNTGRFTGQLNYSYSRTFTRVITPYSIEKVNDGKYYPSNYDRPHNLSILTKLRLRGGWSFYTYFIYTSGRPATYPDGNYSFNNTIVTNYSQRNMDRLPDYHRLDISFSCVTRRFAAQKRYSIWNFSFYNLYGRPNTYSVFFRRESSALKAYRLSVIGSVIPSISWNYNF